MPGLCVCASCQVESTDGEGVGALGGSHGDRALKRRCVFALPSFHARVERLVMIEHTPYLPCERGCIDFAFNSCAIDVTWFSLTLQLSFLYRACVRGTDYDQFCCGCILIFIVNSSTAEKFLVCRYMM